MRKLENIFQGNWDEIKGKLKKQWGKLTDNEIEEINGSYEEFVGKIKKAYGYEGKQLEKEISNFFDTEGFEINDKAMELKTKASENMDKLKGVVKECMNEYFEQIKDSTTNAEEKIVTYCKENPLKSAAIIALAGITISAVLTKMIG